MRISRWAVLQVIIYLGEEHTEWFNDALYEVSNEPFGVIHGSLVANLSGAQTTYTRTAAQGPRATSVSCDEK